MITGTEPIDAFEYDTTDGRGLHTGLTIRQHFAAMAMQGLRAGNLKKEIGNRIPSVVLWRPDEVAQLAVADADALIAELNKEK